MAKVWVLDTETKGTGAEVVPLDKVLERRSAPRRERLSVVRRRTDAESQPEATETPEPRRRRSFKLVDVVSRRVLAEGVGLREAVDLLERVRSVVDVRVYVWAAEAEQWRPLTLGEQKLLWGLRGR